MNPVLDVDQYPLPNIEDIFATLSGGAYFSKLDLSNAYQQLELEGDAKDVLTINTHKGLFRIESLNLVFLVLLPYFSQSWIGYCLV